MLKLFYLSIGLSRLLEINCNIQWSSAKLLLTIYNIYLVTVSAKLTGIVVVPFLCVYNSVEVAEPSQIDFSEVLSTNLKKKILQNPDCQLDQVIKFTLLKEKFNF